MKGELIMQYEDQEEAVCYGCEESVPPGENCNECAEIFCSDCWAEHTFTCYECEEDAHLDDEQYCEDCCEVFCSDCWNEHVYMCFECGDPTHQDDAYYCAECGEHFCSMCWENINSSYDYCGNCRSDGPIYPCSYTPAFCPKGDTSHTMMGVELEVGYYEHNVVDAVQAIDADEDHLYMKEDGSIQGVEIVTHPMTLEWARQYKFDEMLRRLRSNGCCVDEDYGLHVHVSRAAFRQRSSANRRRGYGSQSQHHQMMWLMFLYRNADGLRLLARRDSDQWASFRSPRPGELKDKARGPYGSDRYVAVNCNNSATYELRFFQSTLNAEEFWAALEFADASVRYTRNLSSSEVLKGGGLSWDRFTDWCSEHDYTNLHAQILKTN